MTDSLRLERGDGPLVALAIHDGHDVRDEVRPLLALDDAGRLREEDPFTGTWAEVAPTRLVARDSRFQVDLNRPREQAVYLTPDDAWGLQVWRDVLPPDVVRASLAEYDAFYGILGEVCEDLQRRYGSFLVLDLHSYNHRRDGPTAPQADPVANPQVNVGTGTMRDRGRWAGVIDRFISGLHAFDFPGGSLDARENVRFRGGNCARWIHGSFDGACVLSVEVKKFFMDEWTGRPDPVLLPAVGRAVASAVPGALEVLARS